MSLRTGSGFIALTVAYCDIVFAWLVGWLVVDRMRCDDVRHQQQGNNNNKKKKMMMMMMGTSVQLMTTGSRGIRHAILHLLQV